MGKQTLLGSLELVWWIVTLVILGGVLYPIYRVAPDYPFWIPNIVFIVVFITAARYIFLLRHTWLARPEKPKLLLMLLALPLFFYLVNEINYLQTYLDENTFEGFLGHLSGKRLLSMTKYIRSEMLFFGVGAIIAIIVLFFRLLRSIWLVRNRPGRV